LIASQGGLLAARSPEGASAFCGERVKGINVLLRVSAKKETRQKECC